MKPEISLIFGHYSEDFERDKLALQCIIALQQFRNNLNLNIELIVSCNGHYQGHLKEYADKYIERDADLKPGKTMNDGIKVADGDIFILLANDVLLRTGAIEKTAEILRKYPRYLATPVYYNPRKWHELPMVDGYCVNTRAGSDCLGMTRKQYEDIGPLDEVLINFDMINYINRWMRKGYAVMLTKEILGRNIANGVHSYVKQQKQFKFKKWASRKTIFHPENLKVEDLYDL